MTSSRPGRLHRKVKVSLGCTARPYPKQKKKVQNNYTEGKRRHTTKENRMYDYIHASTHTQISHMNIYTHIYTHDTFMQTDRQ
jgi:hypothetical protein